MPYLINTNKLYRIWFSKNPEIFLNLENQLRFIRLRTDNPQAQISFIYSSAYLSEEAKNKLIQFCQEYKILPFDFDTDLETATLNAYTTYSVFKSNIAQLDRKLYLLAKAEILKAIQNEGGNLGAASDIVRLLEPAAMLGIYSDFDVKLNFKSLPSANITSNAPILLPGEFHNVLNILNNEFIAVAKNKHGNIHLHAQKQLKNLKKRIVKNYNTPKKTLLNGLGFNTNPILSYCIHHFFEQDPTATLLEFRNHIEMLTLSKILVALPAKFLQEILKAPYSSLSKNTKYTLFGEYLKNLNKNIRPTRDTQERAMQEVEIIKHFLYKISVINFSGPVILMYLFRKKETGNFTLEMLMEFNKKIKLSLVYNSDLKHCIKTMQTNDNLMLAKENNDNPLDIVGTFGDQAWTPLGAFKQKQREEKMDVATSAIQHAWRKHTQKQPEQKMESPTHNAKNIAKKPKSPGK